MKKRFTFVFMILVSPFVFAQSEPDVPQPVESNTVTLDPAPPVGPTVIPIVIPTPAPTTQVPVAAPRVQDERNSRRGFFLGLNVGGGGLHVTSNGDYLDRAAAFTGFRIGGGITENILAMAEYFTSVTEYGDSTLAINSLDFSVQWFPIRNFYIRPGLGFGITGASASDESTTVTVVSSSGLSLLGALGYEFRFGRMFGLSPEFVLNYDHIAAVNFLSYGVAVAGMFYF